MILNFDNPPQFKTIALKYPNRDYSYSKEFKAQQEKAYSIFPLKIHGTKEHALKIAGKIARKNTWDIASVDTNQFRIEATATTKILKFKDDIVIEIRELEHDSIEVYMRSKSRRGHGDFGANAKRIASFLQELKEEISHE